jgi:hypothetical protein
LDRLFPVAEGIRAFSKDDRVEFSCVCYSSSIPALYFEKEWIAAIASMGASLDIDLYIDPEDG